jgi:glycosidase
MHYALDFAYPNPGLLMNFLDNHDVDRYSLAVERDVRKYKMALAMLLTTRGYPQIYYGTEIMLDGTPGTYEGNRFNIPGGWKEDERDAFSAEGRTDEENEIFNYLKTLLHYRKNNPVLHQGKMKHFIPENGIYVYFRYNDDKTVMVVANNNENESVVSLERYNEMLAGKVSARDIVTNKNLSLKESLSVSAKTVLILEL